MSSDNRDHHSEDHCLTGDAGAGEASRLFIGLGSNLGDREANLREAIARIEKIGLFVTRVSSVYETEPVGYKNQQWFLNQVIECRFRSGVDTGCDKLTADFDSEIAFRISAQGLLHLLLSIEEEMGRKRLITGGPRIVDIDLLLYADKKIEIAQRTGAKDLRYPKGVGADLIIPHPRMHLRRFVLEPLCEIAPRFIHPTSGKSCRELLAALDDPSIVRLYPSGR